MSVTKCFECDKKISKGVFLCSRGGKGKLYIPIFNAFCNKKCLLKCVNKQIEIFDDEIED